ncbi:MAG: 2-oxoglutarate dehydrogenase complex dihydrolipoyllysine-residue succinyltransferase [Saprospiraceae bacterium]|nr:2-oxoglutarate dehydrogenase complex dihydrolipoyllysine-residue succinyltransferase [Saprospiraceae bacterium]
MSIIDVKVPAIGESITEVTLANWLKPNGSVVKMDEPLCEFESDKATLELPAEAAGKLEWVAQEGDDLEIGALVARIDTSVSAEESPSTGEETPAPAPQPKEKDSEETPETPAPAPQTNYATGHPSPAAAKTLREKGVDPATVTGTGKDGRITKEDASKAQPAPAAAPAKEPAKATPTPASTSLSRNVERKKMSRMRRTIARRLVAAKNETAMLTTFNEVDMTAILALRKKYQEDFVAKYGIKLGFMSLFAKACAQVLLEMPEVNAMIDGDDFIYHDYVDISIAVSTPNGLVVPPVHNVESLPLHEIEYRIKALADKARDGNLSLDEMKGGTFTITNGGIFGSLMSTPIINEPQSAILGMHAIKERPMVVDGQIVIRPMMYIALSYDHRVIDGSSSVTFLVKVKDLLEDPVKLLMQI